MFREKMTLKMSSGKLRPFCLGPNASIKCISFNNAIGPIKMQNNHDNIDYTLVCVYVTGYAGTGDLGFVLICLYF